MKNTKLYLSYKVSLSQALWKFSLQALPLKCCLPWNTFSHIHLNMGKSCLYHCFSRVCGCMWGAVVSGFGFCPHLMPSSFSCVTASEYFGFMAVTSSQGACTATTVMLGFLWGAGVLGREPRLLGSQCLFPAALGWLQSWESCACLLSVTTTVTQINLVFLLSYEV